jgi:hypothetical protein
MYHILALIAGIGTMVYGPVPAFDSLESCQEYLTTETYATALAGLKDAVAKAGKPDAEITSVCKPIDDGVRQQEH